MLSNRTIRRGIDERGWRVHSCDFPGVFRDFGGDADSFHAARRAYTNDGSMLKRLALLLAVSIAALATSPPLDAAQGSWLWPIEQQRQVIRSFEEPAHEYAAGHRGIKIAAALGASVRAPTDALVLFSGSVAGRGVVTLETPTGFVITLEPITSVLTSGESVAAGDIIGSVATGGPSPPGQLHVGVRLEGRYIDPLPFFGKIPRAVLYPCC